MKMPIIIIKIFADIYKGYPHQKGHPWELPVKKNIYLTGLRQEKPHDMTFFNKSYEFAAVSRNANTLATYQPFFKSLIVAYFFGLYDNARLLRS